MRSLPDLLHLIDYAEINKIIFGDENRNVIMCVAMMWQGYCVLSANHKYFYL